MRSSNRRSSNWMFRLTWGAIYGFLLVLLLDAPNAWAPPCDNSYTYVRIESCS